MELTNLQKEKVDELVNLYNPNQQVKIDFKAPTGSGKTLMATSFISELIVRNPNEKFVFVIATPSSSELPYSFEQKIIQYKQDITLSSFDVEYIESPSESGKSMQKNDCNIRIIPEINKVFIFGKSSFGINRILTTRNVITDFVQIVKDNNYKLIYIRDEAHIGGRIIHDENFEGLMSNNAQLIIRMTATPNFGDLTIFKVILTEEDLNNPEKNEGKYLLKTKPITLLQGDMTDESILDDAIKKFIEIKNEYRILENDGINIKPALLVQVSNEPTDNNDKVFFFETLKLIKKKLNDSDLKWAQYFGNNDKSSNTLINDKFELNDLTDNQSDIDAIIFKIGPATGWDIPRACMLLQLRRVCSDSLNIQTIGRIKRNCYPQLTKNEITDKYYIYSNAPQDNNLKIFEAKVKQKFLNEEFMSIEISNYKNCSKKISEQGLEKDINKFFSDNKNKIIQRIKELFIFDNEELFFKDIHQTTSGGQYSTHISNVFQFKKFYLRFRNNLQNQDILEKCENILNSIWKKDFSKETISNRFPITKEMFFISVISAFRNNFRDLISLHKQYKVKYKVVPAPYNPNVYVELHNTDVNTVETGRINTYLFDANFGNNRSIPLGQNANSPECFVFNKINIFDQDNDGKIQVWGKNFTSSNVNSAYLDKYNKLSHSYFDFIIKFKNNVMLYIEVKGEQDLNPEKTEMLKGAYKDYFDRENISIFDKPVVISIFKVNTNTGSITHESFYDKNEFNSLDLNILSVDELFNYLSSNNQ